MVLDLILLLTIGLKTNHESGTTLADVYIIEKNK
jgi:hypothetical protein